MPNQPHIQLAPPTRRPLRVYTFDPSRGRLLGNEMQMNVRYRELAPGPTDTSGALDQIAVIDYDASRKKYYYPVDLDEPFVLIPNGITPSEADPRFHQQMVYAVVSDTIEQFENALGRRIHWRRAERPQNAPKGWLAEDILTLGLYPHAMQQANAFYSPDAHGILFGYFRAGRHNLGHNLPGQTIFTCLSHDIIVHETTHAILDGLRSHFMEQTNPDVAAFHEAFADLAALFRHFTHREVLLNTIQRTGGRLYTPTLKVDALADQAAHSSLAVSEMERNPLIELAGQFGEATGLYTGLRSAIGTRKTMQELRDATECHERGAILVAAVFDAFFTVYLQRAANHFRIYRAGGGHDREDLPAPLAEALCTEATRTAEQFFRSCARALDYLPPVDVTFGDFLRAVITAETDYDPVDQEGIRRAWMEAFRLRGILPDDALYFSEEALCWPTHDDTLPVGKLPYGSPLGLSYEEREQTHTVLQDFIDRNRAFLQLTPSVEEYRVLSFHPLVRVNCAGSIRWDLAVEIVQTAEVRPTRGAPCLMRGGTTLIISTHSTGGGAVEEQMFPRFVIAKPLDGSVGQARAGTQRSYLEELGYTPDGDPARYRINFALVHGGD